MNKSLNQNSTFHKLLDIYWNSGCSSFLDYTSLRNYYKKLAGLIEVEYNSELSEETKNYLWIAIKAGRQNNVIDYIQYNEVVELLKGRTVIHKSWSSVSKKRATVAINTLLDDMFKARVDSSAKAREFEIVVKGMSDEGSNI